MNAELINRNVLILNQTYEPLQICNVKHAVKLVLLQKASIVKTVNHQVLRTVNITYPVPSIIRIQKYIRIRQWEAVLNKENIFRRDNYTCQYCGTKTSPLTVDHIIPKVLGGKESWTNLVTACVSCNNRKGDRTPEQAGMPLIKKPGKPHRLYTLQKFAESPFNEWRPYLFLD